MPRRIHYEHRPHHVPVALALALAIAIALVVLLTPKHAHGVEIYAPDLAVGSPASVEAGSG